ncbi:MAG: hypothetical protein A2X91_04030 [Deltaproteobacteria bacterium GWB2_65_81]|nr:MAG: hypothetical protein A2X90_00305 [Deltaproteobacteria bacterium GWA2_65_63]OGP27416.1 MAG: hypothetical protein A2X91_04030 [Deltaproteobacteria bacterium GWB2_65_81]OGP37678.1 MAG: hypothetical protein A2X98_04110 [Deltaproteobacteria bacterium GWC2_66_88]HAM33591.1 hypothetical protein [Deltaproteobacteria bacterium]
MEAVKANHPRSVYELARDVRRDVKKVSTELAILQELGLVELKKTETPRGYVRPPVAYDSIILDIAV